MSRAAAALACAALLGSGCSFGMSRVPGDWNPAEELRCTESLRRPLFDALVGSASAGGSLLLYREGVSCEPSCGAEAYAGSVVLAVAAVPMLLASGYGFYQAHRCRSSRGEREELLEIEDGAR